MLGRALILVAASAAVAASFAAAAYALTRPSRPLPIYHVAPTVRCLHARGYTVSGPYRVHGWVNIAVRFTRDDYPLTFSFMASEKEAQAGNTADSVAMVTRRNVIFDAYALPEAAVPVANCLRS